MRLEPKGKLRLKTAKPPSNAVNKGKPAMQNIGTVREFAQVPLRSAFAHAQDLIADLDQFQRDLLHDIRPGDRTLLQLATGAGKTRIAVAWAALRAPTSVRPLYFIVHRKE